MFRGFDVVYPEYEVITPQTQMSLSFRTMTVQDEEKLKGSFITQNSVTEHLNRCLYDLVVKKPDQIKDYESFLKSLTVKDRDALMYGLYHISYGEIRNYSIECSDCEKEYMVKVKISDTFNVTPYESDDILSKIVPIKLDIAKNITCWIKQPTLFEEEEATKNLMGRPGINMDIVSETLIINRFEQIEPDEKVYDDRIDIIDAYRSLPAKDKRQIISSYNEQFGKYNIELKMNSTCRYCGHEEVSTIDIVIAFFRALYE